MAFNPYAFNSMQRISSQSQQAPDASNQFYQAGANPWGPRMPFFPTGQDYLSYFANYRAPGAATPAPTTPTANPYTPRPPSTPDGGGVISEPTPPNGGYMPGLDSRGLSMG